MVLYSICNCRQGGVLPATTTTTTTTAANNNNNTTTNNDISNETNTAKVEYFPQKYEYKRSTAKEYTAIYMIT